MSTIQSSLGPPPIQLSRAGSKKAKTAASREYRYQQLVYRTRARLAQDQRPGSQSSDEAISDVTDLSTQERPKVPYKFHIFRRGLGTGTYSIGSHKTVTKFLIKVHSRFSRLPLVVLHWGPIESPLPLASVTGICPNWKITLNCPFENSNVHEELLLEEPNFAGPCFSTFKFCTEVGNGGTRELFEWRNNGWWELVRVDAQLSSRKNSISNVSEDDSMMTPSQDDGVVARMLHVWAKGSRQADFRFFGPGANGELGSKWEIMAVMSALTIFRQVRRHSLRPPS